MKIIDTGLKINVPYSNKPSYIIVHHALAKKCTIKDVHNWHLDLGWAGFGYNFFIDKKGNIFKGREIKQRGSHCKEQRMNYLSIGICLEGCYEEYKDQTDTEVPEKQLEALTELCKQLMLEHNIPIQNVKPHRELATYKKCPGDYFPWNEFIKGISTDLDYKMRKLEEENAYLKKEFEKEQKKYVTLVSALKTIANVTR